MNGGQAATLLTALTGCFAGVGGIIIAALNRRDAAHRAEAAEQAEAERLNRELQHASRDDLQAIIAAQRIFIEDSEARIDRLQNQLATASAHVDELAEHLTACTENCRLRLVEIQALRRRVTELEMP